MEKLETVDHGNMASTIAPDAKSYTKAINVVARYGWNDAWGIGLRRFLS